jgi:Zn-dependent protease
MDNAFWSWSLKIYRTSSLEVRASWLLGVWMLFDLVTFSRSQLWALLPLAIIVPFTSMYLHAMAHVIVARLVGGTVDLTVLSILNDRTHMQLPMQPAKQFAAGAAGPLMSLILWLGFALVGKSEHGPLTSITLSYIADTNSSITIYNLLACAVFDGARIWRAILWPLFGLRRAIRWTVILSFVCSVGIIALGIWSRDMLYFFFGIVCLIVTIHEHRSVKLGFDPILQIEFETIEGRRSQSWFGRWQQRRAVRAMERRQREEDEDQLILDRLLIKVGEQGLPSLTAAERTTLQRISKKQKARQETGVL